MLFYNLAYTYIKALHIFALQLFFLPQAQQEQSSSLAKPKIIFHLLII